MAPPSCRARARGVDTDRVRVFHNSQPDDLPSVADLAQVRVTPYLRRNPIANAAHDRRGVERGGWGRGWGVACCCRLVSRPQDGFDQTTVARATSKSFSFSEIHGDGGSV